jgi:hypothetical protein
MRQALVDEEQLVRVRRAATVAVAGDARHREDVLHQLLTTHNNAALKPIRTLASREQAADERVDSFDRRIAEMSALLDSLNAKHTAAMARRQQLSAREDLVIKAERQCDVDAAMRKQKEQAIEARAWGLAKRETDIDVLTQELELRECNVERQRLQHTQQLKAVAALDAARVHAAHQMSIERDSDDDVEGKY